MHKYNNTKAFNMDTKFEILCSVINAIKENSAVKLNVAQKTQKDTKLYVQITLLHLTAWIH